MSSLQRRTSALEGSQDGRCSACWAVMIKALSAYVVALVRHGVPLNVVKAHFDDAVNGTTVQDAFMASVMPKVQAELAAATRACNRYKQMSGVCAGWLACRKAKGPYEA